MGNVLARVSLPGGATLRVTAYNTDNPWVGSSFETISESGLNFVTLAYYFSPTTAAEYGAALIEAAKAAGWAPTVTEEAA